MGRRKIEIKAIKDDRNRSVTFLKRKGGLFKKAHELSVLCSVDVAVIIFGNNKKLYEFSSGNINETIRRHQYNGQAHEHKGPEDFMGKRDVDDDEDDDDNIGSPAGSNSPPEHVMTDRHIQSQPTFQRVRNTTPSASPPMQNGIHFVNRHPSPQAPPGLSKPDPRGHIRRASSNLAPPHHPASQQPVPANKFTYMPNNRIYNSQPAQGVAMKGPNTPHQPHHYQYAHPPTTHAQQAYMQEQRRQSLPTAFTSHDRPQQPMTPSPPSRPEQPPFQTKQLDTTLKNNRQHSIYTPIEDSRSVLAQRWSMQTMTTDPQRTEPVVKLEPGHRSQHLDIVSPSRIQTNGGPSCPQTQAMSQASPQRTASTTSLPNIPSRASSIPPEAKRPRLKVQIPSEHSDEGSATAGSSPKGKGMAEETHPKAGGDVSHSSAVVLPAPSPSASALLSAGTSGPPNPYARPAPPVGGSYGGRNETMETPMSALPSRFVSNELLPSPSSFYPEWGFGRDPSIMPSPLTFQTPYVPNGPGSRSEDTGQKRKTSDGSESGLNKRAKG